MEASNNYDRKSIQYKPTKKNAITKTVKVITNIVKHNSFVLKVETFLIQLTIKF